VECAEPSILSVYEVLNGKTTESGLNVRTVLEFDQIRLPATAGVMENAARTEAVSIALEKVIFTGPEAANAVSLFVGVLATTTGTARLSIWRSRKSVVPAPMKSSTESAAYPGVSNRSVWYPCLIPSNM
jgi:hypothetical protein